MKTDIQSRFFTLVTLLAAVTFAATAGFADADTLNNTGEGDTEQMRHTGMNDDTAPWNMRYGSVRPNYKHQDSMGYNDKNVMMNGGTGPGNMGYGGIGMMSGMGYGTMQALHLDQDQRNKWRALMHKQRTANCATMNEVLDVRDELAAEYDKPQTDTKAIGNLYGKMQGMQRRMFERMVETRNKQREMLNKDQKEIFDRMRHSDMMNMME